MKKTGFSKILGGFLLSASFLITACGNSGGDTNPNKITFWHTFGQDIQIVMQNKIDQFEEIYERETGEKIEVEMAYQGGYDEILDKVSKGFAVGNTPTIAVAYPDHVADYISLESGDTQWVYNLDDFMNDPEIGFDKQEYFNPSLKGADDFVPSFIEEGQQYVKKGTYSLPLMKSSEVLLYNQELLAVVLADYDENINNIAEYEQNLMHYALSQLESVPDLTLYGPQNRLGVIAFNLGKHHAYDVGSFLDNYGIAVRTGHHCAMPLMAYYNVPAMCRASLAMYNTHEEVDRLVTGLKRIHHLLG